jgi:hypothetical protein
MERIQAAAEAARRRLKLAGGAAIATSSHTHVHEARLEAERMEAEAEVAHQKHEHAKVKWTHASTSAVDWQQKKDAEAAAEAARIEMERIQAAAKSARRRELEIKARHELEEAQRVQYETQVEKAYHTKLHVSTRWGAGTVTDQAAAKMEVEAKEQLARSEVEYREAEAKDAQHQHQQAIMRLEDAKKRAADWQELKQAEADVEVTQADARAKHHAAEAARHRYGVAHSGVLAITTSHEHIEAVQLEARVKEAVADAAAQRHEDAASKWKNAMGKLNPRDEQMAKAAVDAAKAEHDRARAEATQFKQHLSKLRAVGARRGQQLQGGLPTSLSDSALDVGSSLSGASKLVFADGSTMPVGVQDAGVNVTHNANSQSPEATTPEEARLVPLLSPMPQQGRSTADALIDLPLDPTSARIYNHMHETYRPNFGFTKQHISAVALAPEMSSVARASALPTRLTSGEVHVGAGAEVAKLLELNLKKLDLLDAMDLGGEQGEGEDSEDDAKQLEIESAQLEQLMLRLEELGQDEPELGGDTRWVHDSEVEVGSALVGGLVSSHGLGLHQEPF